MKVEIGNQFRLIYKTIDNQFTIGKCYTLYSINWSSAYRCQLYWFIGDNETKYFVTEDLFYKMFKSVRQERKEKLQKINEIRIYI